MFTEDEKKLLWKIGIANAIIENPQNHDLSELEDKVADYLAECFDTDNNPNEDGLVCERILDKLS